MKIRFLLSTIILCLCISVSGQAFAENSRARTIYLKDGSLLRGEVIEMKDGNYTIKTGNLGTFQLHQSKISTISQSNPRMQPNTQQQGREVQTPNITPQNNQWDSVQTPQRVQKVIRATNGAMKNMPPEAQAMSRILLSDPELMQDIQSLASDPQIAAIMSDPKLMNALMSGNLDAVGSNANAKALMNNPKMKKFMDKFGSKMMIPNK